MASRLNLAFAAGVLCTLAAHPSTAMSNKAFASSTDRSETGVVKGSSRAHLFRTVRCSARDAITLIPATQATEEFIAASFGNSDVGSVRYSADPNEGESSQGGLPSDVIATNCKDGKFRFDKVPAGEYFIVSYLQGYEKDRQGGGFTVGAAATVGRLPGGGMPGRGFRGISMMERIMVPAGEQVTVHLRPRNAVDFSDTPKGRIASN